LAGAHHFLLLAILMLEKIDVSVELRRIETHRTGDDEDSCRAVLLEDRTVH